MGVALALGSPFPGDGSPFAHMLVWKELVAFLSLVCDWNASFPVNCGDFTIEALSHLNGCCWDATLTHLIFLSNFPLLGLCLHSTSA